MSLENFKKIIFTVFNRFPLSALISIIAFILMIINVRFDYLFNQSTINILLKTFITLSITFFFSVALYLFSENRGFKNTKKLYYQLFSFIFGFLFYYYFEEGLFSDYQPETIIYITLTIIGIIAFLFIAKYLKNFTITVKNQEEFYISSYILILKFLMSTIIGITTMILGFIAISSIFTLFDITLIENNWYSYWTAFSLILFTPFFFMANLPTLEENNSIKIIDISSNKFFSFLINYIGLPAIFIYFIILYIYTIKVLINFSEWPHGKVSWIVILFSFFGYLIYFASFAFEKELKQVKLFRKILPTAVIFQTIMLFYAIGLRINQYDLTIDRYLVVIFGLWLFFLSAYYIFSKKKNLYTSFYSLLVVVILMSIGPWSIYVVPERRQMKRLEKNLQKANILQNSKIVPLNNYKDIDAKISGEIYGNIKYLCKFHGCKALNKLFSDEIIKIKEEDKKEFERRKKERLEKLKKRNVEKNIIEKEEKNKYKGINSWKLINALSDYIKAKQWYYSTKRDEESKFLNFENVSFFNFGNNIKISGYDYYISLSQNKDNKNDIINNIINIQKDQNNNQEKNYFAIIDTQNELLTLYLGDELLEKINIKESVFDKILNNNNYISDTYIEPEYNSQNSKTLLLKNKDMSFKIKGKNYDILLVLKTISILNPKRSNKDKQNTNVMNIKFIKSYPQGYILIKHH